MAEPTFPIDLSNGGGPSVRAEATVRRDRKRLHIPNSLAERLGFRLEPADIGSTTLTALNCHVTLFGRSETMRAIVDDESETCTLGAILLMALDLVVDPITGLPTPRDPNDFVIDL